MASQFVLMGQKRFLPFFISQFLGALNDNVFKFALTALATWSAARWGGLAPSQGAAVIGGLFVLPFALFSAQAGQLADKFDKAVLTRRVKEFELVALGVGSAGFLLHRPALAFGAVFLMGMHSALFGPVKYAYLPQHLKESELTGETVWWRWGRLWRF